MSWRAFVSRNVAELRFIVCPTSQSSAATRAFYEKNYQTIKMLNPRMPFLIRAADNASPRVIARYDWNAKEAIELEGLDEAGVSSAVESLVKKGETMARSPESLDVVRLPTVVE
mmetsp:Transcript_32756/g.67134  ORF Transcript_32756/g.67134 Transcript_32756/m.67134 type:complete len:114 (+) Transcript_32756:40-381(+)